jgi:Ca2+-binding RTX toxin-like protein
MKGTCHRRRNAIRARSVLALLTLFAMTLASAALTAPVALGATTETPYDAHRVGAPDPQALGRYGDRLETAGDINGDGVRDLWVAAYRHDIGSFENAGRVWALSGADRSVIYRIDSPEPQSSRAGFAGFGWSITNLGDVNGDGRDDLAAGSVAHSVHTGSGAPCGAPEPNGCNENQGKAWVFNGATGALLHALHNPAPQAQGAFGWTGTAGDVTGDGVSEVLVGAFQNDSTPGCGNQSVLPAGCRRNQGQAFVFNGATGALVRTLEIPAADRYLYASGVCDRDCGELGIVAQGPGDVDGDGVPDQQVTAWAHSVYTGVGAPCGTPEPNGCNERQGRIYVYSGRTGGVIRTIDDPVPQEGAQFGLQIVEKNAPGDVNGDGFADLYGNGFVQDGPPPERRMAEGQAWVFDGRTGAVLYRLTDPTPEDSGQFGYSMVRTDYDRDGRPDLYVGSSPHHHAGTPQTGGTYIFKGQDGSLLKILDLPATEAQHGTTGNLGPQLGRSVAAPGDLNGDGEPDYVAAAPTLDVGANQDEGALFVFQSPGRCAGLRPTVVGTTGPDNLVGTPGSDVMVGLGGDDTISGLGGYDVICGGPGDDFVIGDTGTDVLYGDAGNDQLSGGDDSDALYGGAGKDRLLGGAAPDYLRGGDADDALFGGDHNDQLYGDVGDDALDGEGSTGSPGNYCRGGAGTDTAARCQTVLEVP